MKSLLFKKIYSDLYCGISFFSRLPVHKLYKENYPFSFSRSIWTWSFVASILGGIEGVFCYLLCLTPFNPWIISFLTLGFQLLLTGALHEDGLADVADGFGGGKTISQKLEIMKDSHLGSYGVLTLITIIGIKISCLSDLIHTPLKIIPTLTACAVLSRIAILLPLYLLNPARSTGFTTELHYIPYSATCFNIVTGLLLFFFLLPFSIAIICLGIICCLGCLFCYFSQQQINGYTGDILGTIQVLSSTAILLTITMSLH